MKLTTRYMTKNDCYKAGKKINPEGIMVHSTATPGIMAANWYSRWNKSYSAGEVAVQACVHAFLDDKEVCQYLPWNHRAWHSGGKANNTHIAFEICEPGTFKYGGGSTMVGYDIASNQDYFNKIYANTVELCVTLCKMYNLTEKDIICHSEGYKKGVATNHGDVMHWFPKHGKSMDTLREDVRRAITASTNITPALSTSQPLIDRNVLAIQKVLNKLEVKDANGNKLSEDGVMGNCTISAIKKFQNIVGLNADGIAGDKTQYAINEIIAKPLSSINRKPSRSVIKYIQFRINVSNDGVWGKITDKAVSTWQSKNGLSGDRIIGANTWTKMIG